MRHHHRLLATLIDLSIRRPRAVVALVLVLFVAAATQLPRIKIDTDPENMLAQDQAARLLHQEAKEDFLLHDLLIVGVVNELDPDGVFNPATLTRVHDLTRGIEQIDGVIVPDILSLAAIDNIAQGGPGTVRFAWMMRTPPETRAEALAIRDAARRLPMVVGSIVSEDEKAAGIYVPIAGKDQSHRIATRIEELVASGGGNDRVFITGLPVAEDTFGVEMFKEMGITAPLAGLIIMIVMWIFFRSFALVLSPMILAIVTVTITMGALIAGRFTVHIMSSMIPIFLMPIAVVDSVHILSEFSDMYPRVRDKKETMRLVMGDLLRPMHFTSLTSAVGFASLLLAPIPPVRVFGFFVALGIVLAFYLTITFIPAYVVLLSDKRIAALRCRPSHGHNWLGRLLARIGPWSVARARLVAVVTAIVVVISVLGITRIVINDNPVKWFRPSHKIRVADRVLNEHFGGTYNAYVVLTKTGDDTESLERAVETRLAQASREGIELAQRWDYIKDSVEGEPHGEYFGALIDRILGEIDAAESDAAAYTWEDVLSIVEDAETAAKYFQSPEALQYISDLQTTLVGHGRVGKATSLGDIVKTVYRELHEGDDEYFAIPASSNAVAQTLLSFQSSHRPHDLWHFVTPDYRKAQIWLQLESGDNRDMAEVTGVAETYVESHPLPAGVELGWAGLTYLNVVWQEKMVAGMRNSLIGSFVIVFVMMAFLFRSFWFGLLAMLPLSVTIALIYGAIGLAGKDYDMPVAVLSSLTLGLSVDFAIHLLQRVRQIYSGSRNWSVTVHDLFADPARAISRNAIVIAIGFLPLLASPLAPYNTVGFFLAAIMIASCGVTLVLLPGVIGLLRGRLFRGDVEADDAPTTHSGDGGLPRTPVLELEGEPR